MNYFLISVSNRQNLELCVNYALAGFTNSINGLWTFTEIQEGDFISFLYGARVFNLYKVLKKIAIKKAEKLGPWSSITFKMSGKTYYFPFRIFLEPIRKFNEPMVRQEFSYVAENLLLRGGYRKTHFQADQLTLNAVSQMGVFYSQRIKKFNEKYESFTPMITWNRKLINPPETYYFHEFILQSIIRQYLSVGENLQKLFNILEWGYLDAKDFEVLGEKALSEGHIDILIKEARPVGKTRKIILEIKTGRANPFDINQLENYLLEIGNECEGGVLIAKNFSKEVIKRGKNKKNIKYIRYSFNGIDKNQKHSIEKLKTNLNLIKV